MAVGLLAARGLVDSPKPKLYHHLLDLDWDAVVTLRADQVAVIFELPAAVRAAG